MGYHCRICKKPLSDFTSVKIGIGPICRARMSFQGELMLENHAVFRIIEETPRYIYIMDTGNRHNCKTVTNDIKWVLEELDNLCDIQHKRIFYMDSEGHIDEVLHKETLLIGFKAGHEGVNL